MGLELAKAFVTIRADSQALGGDMNAIKADLQKQVADISAVSAGLLTGVAFAGASVLGIGVKLAGEMQQAEISFGTMLGSAQKAKDLLAELDTFAASTPFELPGIVNATKVLLAFGFEQEAIMPNLKMLGDIAAGTGKDFTELSIIFGKIKANGRLMGEQMNQLVESGIPIISALAEHFGVAESKIKKMGEQGKISFKDVEAALGGMTKKGGLFFNMMDAQSKSLFGVLSTLKDNISKVLREIAQGVIGPMTSFAAVVIKIVQGIGGLLRIMGPLPGVVIAVTTAVTGLAAGLIVARAAIVALGISVKSALIGTGIGIFFIVAGTALGIFVTGIMQLVKWLRTLKVVQEAVKVVTDAVSGVWERLQAVFDSFVADAATRIGALQNKLQGFMPLIKIWADLIVSAFNLLLMSIRPVMEQIAAMFGITFGANTVSDVNDTIFAILDTIIEFALDTAEWLTVIAQNWIVVWELIKTHVQLIVSQMFDFFLNFWTALPQLASAALDAIIVGFDGLLVLVGHTVQRWIDIFKTGFETIMAVISAIMSGGDIGAAVSKGLSGIGAIMKAQLSEVTGIGLAMQAAFKSGVSGVDLFKPSDQTKFLKEQRDRLEAMLKKAKGDLEAKRPVIKPKIDGDETKESIDAIIEQAVKETPISLKLGRVGFSSFGGKIQDWLLKQGKEDTGKKTVSLLAAGNKTQDGILKAVKDLPGPPGLTADR